jgi:hypothetical protein
MNECIDPYILNLDIKWKLAWHQSRFTAYTHGRECWMGVKADLDGSLPLSESNP